MRTSRAFTLVELLAALALSAAMMTVGFQVLRTIARPEARTTPGWLAPLSQQLRWDAIHAIAWRPSGENDVELAGFVATDPATLDPLHRPAIVRFHVERISDIDWLVRDESTLGPRSGRPTTSQLLCAGVRAIRVANLDAASRTPRAGSPAWSRDASVPPVFRDLPGLARTPDRFNLIVEFDDAGRPPLIVEGGTP